MDVCEHCGGSVARPGLSKAAWGGMYCGIRCVYVAENAKARVRAEQEAAVRARIASERQQIERRVRSEVAVERAREEANRA